MKRNKDPIKVNVFYPETDEEMNNLRSEMTKVMVSIFHNQVGDEKFHEIRVLMEEHNKSI